ncbi:MAG: munIC [Bacteroidetes bacterium]|nr:munIC [Bacteroidota bacterium]
MAEKRRNTELLEKIAKRIKDLRAEHDVTQEVFYNDTGINIGRIERAKRDVGITTIQIICEYFKISLNDFFKKIK